jgi:hypothetical protein
MTRSRVRWFLAIALMAPLALVLEAADRPHLDAGWRTTDIVVDGRQDDWPGTLAPIDPASHTPLSVQVVTDSDALYLRFAASDPAVRLQLVRQGLIVWFDEKGGTKKRLGIHFPVVERGFGGERGQGGGRGGSGSERRGRGQSDAAPDDYEPPNRLDILGPGKNDARSLTLDHASGVEVALHVVEGTALYELKVPLAKSADHPYAIEAAPGQTIGLGLETPKMERPSYGGRSGGFGGGRGGMGGGMGRGGGRREGGEREFQPPKPIKIWATVTLSRPPAR